MNDDLLTKLERLGKLKDSGTITQDEFEKQKALLLGAEQSTPPPVALKKDQVVTPKPASSSASPTKPEQMSTKTKVAIGVLVMAAIGAVVSQGSENKLDAEQPTAAPVAELTASQRSSADSLIALAEASKTSWQYSEENDPMDGKEYFAYIVADNTLDFDFPYAGGSTVTLTIRKKRRETDAYIRVSKGQFIVDYDGGDVRVKVDNKPTSTYSILEAADGSSDIIFIENPKRLIAALKGSKSVIIEAQFYNEGSRKAQFSTKGFAWKH